MRPLALVLLLGVGLHLVGCGGHGMTHVSGASTLGTPFAGSAAEAATVPAGQTRTSAQWQARFGRAIEQRQAALGACFAGPTNVAKRSTIKLAIRGPLDEHAGLPGAYAGWGKADATLYFGQLPEREGQAPPPDDAFNQCLVAAFAGVAFPSDEKNAVDATWVVTYVPATQTVAVTQ